MAKLRSTRDLVVWAEVLPLLDRKIESALADVAKAEDLRTMGVAQGQLTAYREMKMLPQALLAASELDAADEKQRLAIQRSQDPATWVHSDLVRG